MDFDLDRMGWRQFEHLVQALSLAELGNGVQIYGDGSDGGREATFRGLLDFPEGDGAKWNGYGVIQAKHQHFPSPSPAENAASLIQDIRGELKKFMADKNGRVARTPMPEYYLIASNVRLSPGEDGGLDSVLAELATWETKLGLRGTHVWHYSSISRLLENHEDIRRAFAGFVTAGDVLSSMADYFSGATVPIATQLRTNAGQQLRAKQWVRMADSGLPDESKLPLSQVGIDLPALIVRRNVDSDQEDESRPEPASEVNVVEHVLRRGDLSLREKYRGSDAFGIVVVGGPGQGKSTLGQLVCQAYRVALLDNLSGPSLGENVESLLSAARANIESLGLNLPVNRRWPVLVELSAFADALEKDPQTSLLRFIADAITVSGKKLKASQLERWRRDWPWVLVLDGLDEVAARETRKNVIDRVSDFVIETNSRDDDVLIVATTRPQGYHGEFAEFRPEQLELRDLNPDEGLDYGKKLVSVRHAHDPELAEQVLVRLKAATTNVDTARLMCSPLQVTIMSTLLEQIARVPNTRHALFDAYYGTIYAREVTKAGRLGSILDLHRDDVDFVHAQVGLYLQIQGELGGTSETLLGDEELEKAFVDRLRHEGHPEDDVKLLAADLKKAARQRVVLLVPVRADHVGFEVRALQEYMAARALASGPDELVLERIDALASSAYWRHTLLLTIGRVFTTKPHLRDAVVARIMQLNTTTSIGMFVGHGERLALDLLNDDLALAVPRIRKALLDQSLGALDRWPQPEIRRLAYAAQLAIDGTDKQAADIVKRALTDAFSSTGRANISAVSVLKIWMRKPGHGGALANRLLAQSTGWRPDPTDADRPAKARHTISEAISPYFTSENLTEGQGAAHQRILTLLDGQEVMLGISAAEATGYSRHVISSQVIPQLQAALRDEEILQRLMSAVDSLPVTEAHAAIWLRQVIVILDEQRSVGGDLRIPEGMEGLTK
ncbi:MULTISPECIES: hypothetical protein [unclassified Cryobacterium]|uniref:hypothetical protein n=1 Tax=unclassified Cryobacterium TaxID=2649013 RepID=UPI002AB563C9|nr:MULTISPECIES: hypothetical protein [unclassified Cryobacterium]MDY7528123.1 hypothetical protein [Cryobacterium sp. 10C2]MDY7556128.1 hypothetical protein [Cryobacterium sp. 10C3]MEB0290076.1 hypothetical protein [Cryobacterium sp. 10C2]